MHSKTTRVAGITRSRVGNYFHAFKTLGFIHLFTRAFRTTFSATCLPAYRGRQNRPSGPQTTCIRSFELVVATHAAAADMIVEVSPSSQCACSIGFDSVPSQSFARKTACYPIIVSPRPRYHDAHDQRRDTRVPPRTKPLLSRWMDVYTHPPLRRSRGTFVVARGPHQARRNDKTWLMSTPWLIA